MLRKERWETLARGGKGQRRHFGVSCLGQLAKDQDSYLTVHCFLVPKPPSKPAYGGLVGLDLLFLLIKLQALNSSLALGSVVFSWKPGQYTGWLGDTLRCLEVETGIQLGSCVPILAPVE